VADQGTPTTPQADEAIQRGPTCGMKRPRVSRVLELCVTRGLVGRWSSWLRAGSLNHSPLQVQVCSTRLLCYPILLHRSPPPHACTHTAHATHPTPHHTTPHHTTPHHPARTHTSRRTAGASRGRRCACGWSAGGWAAIRPASTRRAADGMRPPARSRARC